MYSRALGKPDLTREAVCAVPMQTFIEETFPVRCCALSMLLYQAASFHICIDSHAPLNMLCSLQPYASAAAL